DGRARGRLDGEPIASDRCRRSAAPRHPSPGDVRRVLRHPPAGRARLHQLVRGRRGVSRRLLLLPRRGAHLLLQPGARGVSRLLSTRGTARDREGCGVVWRPVARQRPAVDTDRQRAAPLVSEPRLKPLSEIGAAVVGTGFIGAVHVEALRRLGVQVYGVVGSSHDRGAERAAALGLPPAYESFEAMLADPRVDVVHITSPNHLHYPQAVAALAAGEHGGREKPLAMTSVETGELVRLAQASGLVHAVNFNIRFYPICRHLHQLVREGGLGDVRLVSGHYLQDWLLLDTDWNWRLEPGLGGSLRAVADIGSHWMDLTSHIAGQRIVSVMADLKTFIPIRQQPVGPVETFSNKPSGATTARTITTEDCATILLRYENGAIGNLTISQI